MRTQGRPIPASCRLRELRSPVRGIAHPTTLVEASASMITGPSALLPSREGGFPWATWLLQPTASSTSVPAGLATSTARLLGNALSPPPDVEEDNDSTWVSTAAPCRSRCMPRRREERFPRSYSLSPPRDVF
ncbi:uncharacterized protein LOC125940092 isoform X2 [Dermacentor silvarum]|uniref:uncharacterized protein LOC125940092 isoform X2 n=1 Tax=Dermacentor silvarum TaxID=543639 RepID=UPI0021017541|nr:uncharacterized protein LOC125940092 isoform X2 [Dermacentor silvarum]